MYPKSNLNANEKLFSRIQQEKKQIILIITSRSGRFFGDKNETPRFTKLEHVPFPTHTHAIPESGTNRLLAFGWLAPMTLIARIEERNFCRSDWEGGLATRQRLSSTRSNQLVVAVRMRVHKSNQIAQARAREAIRGSGLEATCGYSWRVCC